MIRRLATAIFAFTVFLWLMPLGAFIKPGQEETACGGNRAFHMCSMCFPKAAAGHTAKPGFHSASNFDESAKSMSSGTEILPIGIATAAGEKISRFYGQDFVLSSQIFSSTVFRPPKTLLYP